MRILIENAMKHFYVIVLDIKEKLYFKLFGRHFLFIADLFIYITNSKSYLLSSKYTFQSKCSSLKKWLTTWRCP